MAKKTVKAEDAAKENEAVAAEEAIAEETVKVKKTAKAKKVLKEKAVVTTEETVKEAETAEEPADEEEIDTAEETVVEKETAKEKKAKAKEAAKAKKVKEKEAAKSKNKKKAPEKRDEARAYLRYARISPRKVSIVLDLIRNKDTVTAMAILKNTPKAASEYLVKLLKSCTSNAENNHSMNPNKLYVSECFVCPGPVQKRVMPRAQGRAFRILKRSSHITIAVREKE